VSCGVALMLNLGRLMRSRGDVAALASPIPAGDTHAYFTRERGRIRAELEAHQIEPARRAELPGPAQAPRAPPTNPPDAREDIDMDPQSPPAATAQARRRRLHRTDTLATQDRQVPTPPRQQPEAIAAKDPKTQKDAPAGPR
jgi:hypothetical protein